MLYDLQVLHGDLTGALTVMVVSLPFTVAFGVASGLGAPAGLYASVAEMLNALGVIRSLPQSQSVETMQKARRAAKKLLGYGEQE